MTSSTPRKRPDAMREHRYEVRRQILLPFALVGGVVLTVLVITLLLPQRAQVSLIADLLLTLLVLCPIVLCLFPLMVALWVAVFGLNHVHRGIASGMQRIEDITLSLVERSTAFSQMVEQRFAVLGQYLARFSRVLKVFDPPEEDSEDGVAHDRD